MKRNKFCPIDTIRGVLSLLIVWWHLPMLESMPRNYDFGNTIVLFFFVLSGFHLVLTWQDKTNLSYKEFMIKRCSKIFPFQWLTVLLFALFGINVVSLWAIPFHLTLTQSVIPLWQIYFSLNVPSWFLSSLFFCYILFVPLLSYAKKNKRNFIIGQIGCILLFSAFVYFLPSSVGRRWLVYSNPFSRLLDFSIGMTLGLLWGRIIPYLQNKKRYVYTIGEIVAVILLFVPMFFPTMLRMGSYHIVIYPCIVCCIIAFTISKGLLSQILANNWGNWLGSISMSIYMIHGFFLHFMKDIEGIPLWLNIVYIYIVVLLCSHFINRFFLPFSQKAFYTVCGKFCKLSV